MLPEAPLTCAMRLAVLSCLALGVTDLGTRLA
jgi:hypothetical protein